MRISVEISLYPLQDNYRPLVRGFIEDLQARLAVLPEATQVQNYLRVNGMSSQLFGEWQILMPILEKTLEQTLLKGKMSVVIKMLSTDVGAYEFRQS
ncbi:hypothetical protein [Hugenholtzia roseola]|uniref:hypothetical protein n=1 Tax=Hugenholtzia roseola TaxID=1002 RepID=UPI0004028E8B|nr:hypothetical protein [Hugenholtzia roseola]